MSYTDMEIFEKTKSYPRFADGRIDYTNERVCYALNCIVVCGNEVLLARRGWDVIAYPGTINGISGFIDRTDISVEEQASIELREEVQAPLDKLARLIVCGPIVQTDEAINREWHVYPVLAEFSEKFEPEINWENKEASWHTVTEAKKLELMPGFREVLEIALDTH